MRDATTKRLPSLRLPPAPPEDAAAAITALEQTADVLDHWALRRTKVLRLLDVRAAQSAREIALLARRAAADFRRGEASAATRCDVIQRTARQFLAPHLASDDVALIPELAAPPFDLGCVDPTPGGSHRSMSLSHDTPTTLR